MVVNVRNAPMPWPADRSISPQDGPLPEGTMVASADDHILEADLSWHDYLPAAFRDRAPRMWQGDDQHWHFECEGKLLDNVGFNAVISEGRLGMIDLESRLRDMDDEGVQKQLIFPQRTLALNRIEDAGLREACYKAYNQFLADFCGQAPTRLYGVGILPWWKPDAAHDNLAELKALGYHAFEMASDPKDVRYNSPEMEPLWQAIQESGLPLSFHIGENWSTTGWGSLATFAMINFQPFRKLWSLLTFSGVFDRYPGIQVVFTEGGISWVPSTLYDADKVYRDFEALMKPKLSRPPSSYWSSNCYATFMDDPIGLELLDHIGYDRVLWAMDYPHAESTLGYSHQAVREIFAATSSEKAQAIVGGTAVSLWGMN